jgi:hypothetical protein
MVDFCEWHLADPTSLTSSHELRHVERRSVFVDAFLAQLGQGTAVAGMLGRVVTMLCSFDDKAALQRVLESAGDQLAALTAIEWERALTAALAADQQLVLAVELLEWIARFQSAERLCGAVWSCAAAALERDSFGVVEPWFERIRWRSPYGATDPRRAALVRVGCEHGRTSAVVTLLERLHTDEQNDILLCESPGVYPAVFYAAKRGHVAVLQRLSDMPATGVAAWLRGDRCGWLLSVADASVRTWLVGVSATRDRLREAWSVAVNGNDFESARSLLDLSVSDSSLLDGRESYVLFWLARGGRAEQFFEVLAHQAIASRLSNADLRPHVCCCLLLLGHVEKCRAFADAVWSARLWWQELRHHVNQNNAAAVDFLLHELPRPPASTDRPMLLLNLVCTAIMRMADDSRVLRSLARAPEICNVDTVMTICLGRFPYSTTGGRDSECGFGAEHDVGRAVMTDAILERFTPIVGTGEIEFVLRSVFKEGAAHLAAVLLRFLPTLGAVSPKFSTEEIFASRCPAAVQLLDKTAEISGHHFSRSIDSLSPAFFDALLDLPNFQPLHEAGLFLELIERGDQYRAQIERLLARADFASFIRMFGADIIQVAADADLQWLVDALRGHEACPSVRIK